MTKLSEATFVSRSNKLVAKVWISKKGNLCCRGANLHFNKKTSKFRRYTDPCEPIFVLTTKLKAFVIYDDSIRSIYLAGFPVHLSCLRRIKDKKVKQFISSVFRDDDYNFDYLSRRKTGMFTDDLKLVNWVRKTKIERGLLKKFELRSKADLIRFIKDGIGIEIPSAKEIIKDIKATIELKKFQSEWKTLPWQWWSRGQKGFLKETFEKFGISVEHRFAIEHLLTKNVFDLGEEEIEYRLSSIVIDGWSSDKRLDRLFQEHDNTARRFLAAGYNDKVVAMNTSRNTDDELNLISIQVLSGVRRNKDEA